MKITKLLELASRGYGTDDLVLQYHNEPTKAHGDGLAKFVCNEITETYDSEALDAAQIDEAIRVIHTARSDLGRVIDSLFEHQLVLAQAKLTGGKPS